MVNTYLHGSNSWSNGDIVGNSKIKILAVLHYILQRHCSKFLAARENNVYLRGVLRATIAQQYGSGEKEPCFGFIDKKRAAAGFGNDNA
jgi:hypothetical protein